MTNIISGQKPANTGKNKGGSVTRTARPVYLPVYVYEAYLQQNQLPALAALMKTRAMFPSGMVWRQNTSGRKLARLMGVKSHNTATAYLKVWLAGNCVKYDTNGNLLLNTLLTQKQTHYNLLKINISNDDIQTTINNIRNAYVTAKVKHQQWMAYKKKDVKKVLTHGAPTTPSLQGEAVGGHAKSKQAASTFNMEANTKLSCKTLAGYMGVKTAGAASRLKKQLKGVAFASKAQSRTELGRMYMCDYNCYKDGLTAEQKKGLYINRHGYVYKQEACSVKLADIPQVHKPIYNNTSNCLYSGYPQMNTPVMPLEQDLLDAIETIMNR